MVANRGKLRYNEKHQMLSCQKKEDDTMNKKIVTTMLLILMIASMLVLTVGCGAKDAEQPVEKETTLPTEPMEQTDPPATGESGEDFIREWSLEAKAWSDGNGATVTFTAVPAAYEEGQRAALSVRVGDLEAESTNCNWDGTSYTGSVELSAVDGYGFYCVLTTPEDIQIELVLNAPDNVTDGTLVYLGSSLSTYGNMVVEDWDASGSKLNIRSAHIQVQMPLLTFNNVTPSINSAALVLKLNGEEVERKTVTLNPGEGSGSFETTIVDQSFVMPRMEDDYQLDLWLEAVLNTGNTVSVSGGSWYSSDGQLQLAVG